MRTVKFSIQRINNYQTSACIEYSDGLGVRFDVVGGYRNEADAIEGVKKHVSRWIGEADLVRVEKLGIAWR